MGDACWQISVTGGRAAWRPVHCREVKCVGAQVGAHAVSDKPYIIEMSVRRDIIVSRHHRRRQWHQHRNVIVIDENEVA